MVVSDLIGKVVIFILFSGDINHLMFFLFFFLQTYFYLVTYYNIFIIIILQF